MNFIGDKFDKNNPNRFNRKWICQQIRKDLKEVFGKEWKITVKKSVGEGIDITIRKCSEDVLKADAKGKEWVYSCSANEFIEESVVNKIANIANAYNYDNSDSMTDYFDRNYYLHIGIDLNKEVGK